MNKVNAHLKKTSGVTLIEMIIAVAIVMIVIGAAWTVFAFGNTTFIRGNTQYDIQSDVRLAAGYITNEVRYSTVVELIPEIKTDSFESGFDYITINPATGQLLHFEAANFASPKAYGLNLTDDFSFNSANGNELEVFLSGSHSGQAFSLNHKISLPNLVLLNKDIVIGAETEYKTIRFNNSDPGSFSWDDGGGTPGGTPVDPPGGTIDIEIELPSHNNHRIVYPVGGSTYSVDNKTLKYTFENILLSAGSTFSFDVQYKDSGWNKYGETRIVDLDPANFDDGESTFAIKIP